ncbi:MAG: PfkB family carbohydrate kinase [Bacteroidota bacterium]
MPLDKSRISDISTKIRALKVAVIGDFAVDFYYSLNQNSLEFSLETKKEVFWGSNPKTSLGGAGNVCANLAALGVKQLTPFGVIGNDIYGREMLSLLERIGAARENIIAVNLWNTCTYIKPIEMGIEQNRIDFGTHNHLEEEIFDLLLASLKNNLESLDILIINQQFPKPLLTENRIEKLNAIISHYSHCLCLADLRNNGLSVRNSILKVNVDELAKLLNIRYLNEENTDDCEKYSRLLAEKIQCPLLLTRGKQGILFYDLQNSYQKTALKIDSEIDTVGAGDTVVAAFATAYKTGASIDESLEFANLAAAVSIQKLKQTGTASEKEIIELVS